MLSSRNKEFSSTAATELPCSPSALLRSQLNAAPVACTHDHHSALSYALGRRHLLAGPDLVDDHHLKGP